MSISAISAILGVLLSVFSGSSFLKIHPLNIESTIAIEMNLGKDLDMTHILSVKVD